LSVFRSCITAPIGSPPLGRLSCYLARSVPTCSPRSLLLPSLRLYTRKEYAGGSPLLRSDPSAVPLAGERDKALATQFVVALSPSSLPQAGERDAGSLREFYKMACAKSTTCAAMSASLALRSIAILRNKLYAAFSLIFFCCITMPLARSINLRSAS